MSLPQLNIEMFRGINDLGKQLSFLNPSVVFIAEYTIYLLAACMLLFWFTRTTANRMMVLQGGFAFILAELIGKAVGRFHSHHQPFAELPHVSKLIDHSINNSFPSDHTILFFSICASFWLMRQKNRLGLVVARAGGLCSIISCMGWRTLSCRYCSRRNDWDLLSSARVLVIH